MASPRRVFWWALASAVVLAAVGAGWEIARFGPTDAAAARRLEDRVRRHVSGRSDRVESLARRVAIEHALIRDATTSRDILPQLFNRLEALSAPGGRDPVTVTIYIPDPAGAYRVLAWSDGPAGDVAADLLNGPAALFAAPGTAGLRLVFVQPVESDGRRIAVVAAETVLSAVGQGGAPVLTTALGPVTLIPSYAAGALDLRNAFVIPRPRLEVHFAPDVLALERRAFRLRALSIAACPPVLALVFFVGQFLDTRRRARTIRAWLGASALAVATVVVAVVALIGLLQVLGAPGAIATTLVTGAVLTTVAIVAGGWWWRRGARRMPSASPVRFISEQLTVGSLLLTVTTFSATLLSQGIGATSLVSWQSALFPFDPAGLVDVWNVLLAELAIVWAAAIVMAIVAARWRLTASRPASALAILLWLVPLGIAPALPVQAYAPPGASIALVAGLVLFALTSTWLRRYYRHTTQSMRLLLAFLALVAPLVVLYPLVAVTVERATRAVIEHDYAPQAAGHAEHIRQVLFRTQQEIDAIAALPVQLRDSAARPVESQTAFLVWSQTSLKRTRVVSDLELYGPDRSLISRFALNVPEYLYRAGAKTWQGTGCAWEVSGEVTPLGASERVMLHAQRGVCDRDGTLIGAVVMHVAPTDYQALPFVSSVNPYFDILQANAGATRDTGPPNLELVVYGWSLQPLFTSHAGVAWAIDVPTFERIYKDGRPFWTTLETGGRAYHVYVLQNRAGIHALGYPRGTPVDHAARLGEITAVTALLFVVIQITAALYAPLAHRPEAPLRVLLHEIRTSFYRKLFLFFVLVAVGPVFMFALAFGAYMTAKFRADVESEAASVVTVARRVLEQVAPAEQPIAQEPTDDVMVWIRQVIDQDVNLFNGSELVATSQRDLFNSGYLPTRTPAIVYRRIALDRLPTFVTEDQQYLVAASPVPARGHDAVLSVPLAPRQREIAEELDELKRGVLVGSVLVVLLAAGLGASLASRVSDPVARLTKATRQIAAGRLDVRIAADTADELRRLVDDFNTMTARLLAQRAELARANQLKAWNEMARQVAHEIKNPLTPIQLAAEHLERVHLDRGRPLGEVFDQCIRTVLAQVRLLRQIASEFANFSNEPVSRPETIDIPGLVEAVVGPYRLGLSGRIQIAHDASAALPPIRGDRTLLLRALTNLVENAIQAMPAGGTLRVTEAVEGDRIVVRVTDTGVGMDAEAARRAFEPYFSTKTGGSGLGLANAQRNIEREGGTIAIASVAGQGTTVTIALPISTESPAAP